MISGVMKLLFIKVVLRKQFIFLNYILIYELWFVVRTLDCLDIIHRGCDFFHYSHLLSSLNA